MLLYEEEAFLSLSNLKPVLLFWRQQEQFLLLEITESRPLLSTAFKAKMTTVLMQKRIILMDGVTTQEM